MRRFLQALRNKYTELKFRRIAVMSFPWIVIAFFSLAYIRIGYLNEQYLRNGLDLGTYTQILHNISEGRMLPYNTLKGMTAWGDHAHFIMLAFAPVFKAFPGPLTVIVLQALAICTSAWAVYRVALDKVRSYIFSYAIMLAYLMFFGVQYALDFDFHANVMTAAALSWSMWALHFKKWRWYWITVVLGLATREDAAVFYAIIGTYTLAAGWKDRKLPAAATILISTVYFFAVTYWIMPVWQPAGTPLAYFDATEERNPAKVALWILSEPVTIWQNMTDSPSKAQSMDSLFRAYGYLPLLSPFTYLAALPNLMARFLSPESQRHMMQLHYSASLVSVLAYGAVLSAAWISRYVERALRRSRWKERAQTAAVGMHILLAMLLLWGAYQVSWKDEELPLRRKEEFWTISNVPLTDYPRRSLLRVADMIGEDETVSAASALVPQLAMREKIYNFPEPLPEKTDWVVLSNEYNYWPLGRGEMSGYIREYENSSEYETVWSGDGIWVFKRVR